MTLALLLTDNTPDSARRSLAEVTAGLAARGITVVSPPACGAWALARWLRREGVRAVLATAPEAAVTGGWAARLARVRAAWRVEGPELRGSLTRLHLAAALCGMVLVSAPSANELLHKLLPEAQLTQLPPGIDAAVCAPTPPGTRPLPVIGLPGAWTSAHGQETLARALLLLHAHGQRAALCFTPPGDDPVAARHHALTQGVLKAAGLAGYALTSAAAPLDFLADCDVVVLHAPLDGCPRTALEAAACGRPVVAARHTGLHEIIDDGRTGLLVPAYDPRALADALALLLASPALRREMAARARRRVETHYPLARHLDALQSALGLASTAATQSTHAANGRP